MTLLLASAGTAVALCAYGRDVRADRTTIRGLTVGGRDFGAIPFGALDARIDSFADLWAAQPMTLALGSTTVHRTRAELGLSIDRDALREALEEPGHSGILLRDLATRRRGSRTVALPVHLDRVLALALLADLKGQIDRPPLEARLDLERRTITDAHDGLLLDAYASLDALEQAAGEGADRVELVALVTPPRVGRDQLAHIDISHVIGYWETGYSVAEIDRDYNLKIAAERLDGHVLLPGQLFSFNEVVGPRTERQGYHVAPVINKGELVDGLAGGACQISTTLHAAAFFGGLDIVSTTPHSRPSHYITMGLDSTVVYPTTDLELRNPYDFPVVIHYRVNQGKVRVELLGKERPYKVYLKRTLLEETPFDTDTREDPDLPLGLTAVDQGGAYGYHITKIREIRDGSGRLVKTNKWDVKYPPTTEYDRIGTGDPSLPPPPNLREPKVVTPLPLGNLPDVVRPLPNQI